MNRIVLFSVLTVLAILFYAFGFTFEITNWQETTFLGAAKIMFFIALVCFIVSELTDNYSQTDKLWSIAPIIYVWFYAWSSQWDTRLVLMAVLVSFWGVRLTYNFSRRGGYSLMLWKGEEDYRWSILRSKKPFGNRWAWRLFNLLFISVYQHIIIFLITVPAIAVYSSGSIELYWADYLLAGAFLFFLTIETIADQQQYNFQKEKYRRIKDGEALGEFSHGFCSNGLWGIVRHPNYASEQAIWFVFYLFGISVGLPVVNWSILGAVLLVLLFVGSSSFSENISAEKYPAYKDYVDAVPRFIPLKIKKRDKTVEK